MDIIPPTLHQLLTRLDTLQGLVLFCFATVCAYWAQEKGRNPWMWFFGGLFFGPLAGLVLLYQNSQLRRGKN